MTGNPPFHLSDFTGWRCAGCGAREYTPEAAPGLFEGGKDCTCPHPEWSRMAWVEAIEAERDRYREALYEISRIADGQVTQYARAREQVARIAREALDGPS